MACAIDKAIMHEFHEELGIDALRLYVIKQNRQMILRKVLVFFSRGLDRLASAIPACAPIAAAHGRAFPP